MFIMLFYLLSLLFVLLCGNSFLLEGGLDHCGLGLLSYCFFFDYVSFLFLCMLFFCGVMSLSFCNHYLGGYTGGIVLYWSMVGFLGIMGCLCLSYSYIMSLIMWEYLGVVSFLLILYYANNSSLRATLITLFASRFGDVSFFMLLLWNSFWFLDLSLLLFSFFLCLIILSKSACFPFISWLLEAMRAPTPVSSLVHSSTLVAAGVWFFFRYGCVWGDVASLYNLVLVFCFLSIIISSFCAIVFLDLKKIVALSTCNNISWCLIFFLLGDVWLGLIQLLSHGVCKCFLFISLGDVMSCSGGEQDSRGMFCSRYMGLWGVCAQGVLILSLCGIPFLGVFFSKHCFLGDIFYCYNGFSLFLLFFCFFLSYVYSFRLLLMLWGSAGLSFYGVSSAFFLVFFCTLFGGFCNYFVVSSIYELGGIDWGQSVIFLFIQIVGSCFGIFIYISRFMNFGFSFWSFLIWGCDWLVSYFYFLYNFFLRMSYFISYRWEVYVIGVFSSFQSNIYYGVSWMSLKLLVGSFLFIGAGLYYFFCCLGVVLFAWGFFVPLVFFLISQYTLLVYLIMSSFQVGDLNF